MTQLKITGKGAFVHFFNSCTTGFNAGKFGGTVCIDKTDSETIATLEAGFQQAIREKWGSNPPPDVKIPLKDGDATMANKNFHGYYYLEAHSKDKPCVVDRKKQPISSGKEFSDGCECNFILTLKAYDVDGNVGVTCYLNGVQFVKNGTWSGRTSVADLFDVLDGEDY